jgi:REP element-mobilizing transposase RayT
MPWFSDMNIGQLIVSELKRSDKLGYTCTYAFVVMPNHLHWLFELKHGQTLSQIVATVKGRSAFRISRRFSHVSNVWQAGFQDRALRSIESVEGAAEYVVNNPVRAGLVNRASDYPL